MIRFSESDLLDSVWGRTLSDADVGLAIRLTGLVLRRGHNGVEMGYLEASITGGTRKLNTAGLEAAGICRVDGGRLTLSQTWIYRRLPDRIAKKLMANDLTGEPVELLDQAVTAKARKALAEPGNTNAAMPMRAKDSRRIANPKGARDLVGDEVDRFLSFWDTFNHKFARTAAIKEWVRLEMAWRRGEEACSYEQILRAAGIEAYLRTTRRNATPKYAEGWLSERRFADDGYIDDPRAWTQDEAIIVEAAAKAGIYEVWTEVTPGRRECIRRAVSQLDNDARRVSQYLTVAAQHCSWDSFLQGGHKNGKVPLALALSPQVMTPQREHLKALRAKLQDAPAQIDTHIPPEKKANGTAALPDNVQVH